MAGLATVEESGQTTKLRRGLADHSRCPCPAESLGSLDEKIQSAFRDRADQWRVALSQGLPAGDQTKGMDLEPAKTLSADALCTLHIQRSAGDHRRLVTDLFGICRLCRQSLFCP